MSQLAPVLPDTSALDVPAALMPYQQRWVADTSPLKVIEKSRRTGIT
ncbi:putative portal domain protein [Candidatus Erwinia dacicola]|uniref:Portal domain protein n=2 Tax=Enterobacterales TaxID=91347 RepID=A0A328TP45_9GAMM|nr:putative portal domain protein [Candidatus Erwinia dacicola]